MEDSFPHDTNAETTRNARIANIRRLGGVVDVCFITISAY
jgi:hypothetical protein